ncbi:L-ascorbate metabolism protein UlaG (beta-lactamase superfamily) [Micromonospora sp. Llam0]|uniref:MBL fold metallo-hydrolase n=1 Tax=Micromonospora sp. Llam0 TaxID=2485143 RepID=UPI000F4683FD|nr:MBL fold metallo-hydrolase [Micromonospora sp. Llam0]ROO50950.1 L-ascorbate metabolism protein UlaG (beta-lactamase superfamily) [Micromonospora sp. Llam0]
MRLTKFGHSCVRVERDGGVLVIDPGAFSEPAALDGVDAVLVTHEHFDHLDVGQLTDALARRPSVTIHTHPSVLPKLDGLGEVATAVESGERFEAAGIPVRAYGGWHAEIHPDLPRVPNLGFLIADSVYHPGDSFDVPTDAEVDTLFVPVSAPWLKLSEAVEFVRAVAPRRALALHDGLLNDAGHKVTDGNMTKLAGCDYARLPAGTSVR